MSEPAKKSSREIPQGGSSSAGSAPSPAKPDRVESLARDVFLRFLELPGHAGINTEHLAAQAIEYAEAFYLTWDQRTEK